MLGLSILQHRGAINAANMFGGSHNTHGTCHWRKEEARDLEDIRNVEEAKSFLSIDAGNDDNVLLSDN